MKLNELLKDFRNKCEFVESKEITKVGKVRIFHIKTKNKRSVSYLATVLKNGELIDKVIIAENKIKGTVAQVKKILKQSKNSSSYNNVLNGFRNTEKITKKAEKIKSKIEEKVKKKMVDYKYKNDKEKKDVFFVWFAYAYIREHLVDLGALHIDKNDNYTLKSDDFINKKVFDILKSIGQELSSRGVVTGSIKFDIIKEEHKKIHKKVLNYFKGNDEFYHIVIGLYLITLWKNDVKFKTLKALNIDYKFVADLLESLFESDFIENKVYEDSEDFAKLIYREIYGEHIMTHKETKEMFNKIKTPS